MLKHSLLGGACAAALIVLPLAAADAAAPQDFAGTLSGQFGQSSCSGCGTVTNWGIGGQGAFGLGMYDLGAEVDASYLHSSYSGVHTGTFSIDGNLIWAPDLWRLGPSVGYSSIDTSFGSGHLWNYGGFGEYFFAPQLTAGIQGGGVTLGSGGTSTSGEYLGGGLIGYILPDLGLTGQITWLHGSSLGSTTSYSVTGEWLVTEDLPISVYAGYTATDEPYGLPTLNTWRIGLNFYVGPTGMTLVDRQRNGALDPLVSSGQLKWNVQTSF